MSLPRGSRLDFYEIIAPLGAGGMGEVYLAHDQRLNRDVAIKVLPTCVGSDVLARERLKREALAAAALDHPFICKIFEVAEENESVYFAMEYVRGETLSARINAGRITSSEALRIAGELTEAMEEAHARGVVHRDLKPTNIMLTTQGHVKIMDFGLARLMGNGGGATTLTVAGSVMGTAAYMSPEQVEGKALDQRSDVFSFGAVLYEMLTGKQAFGGETTAQILSAVLCQEPERLQVEPALEQIVRRCLAKRLVERFQSMSEVRRALEGLAGKSVGHKPSVAVLPFSIISADKEDEYFSDGLAEEIINALAHIPGLNVTARTSSFSFRGKDLDIRRVAEMLDVRTILEGSVRRAGNRVRITVQLINAANGYHVWSERYDREMADVFAIQDEIAQAIASSLKVNLAADAALRRHTPGIPAYEAFLKGRHFLRKATPESFRRARECLEQAIALDPDFALAHTELAACLRDSAGWQLETAREALPKARAAAQRALEIDPTLPEAHAEMAAVALFLDYDWEMAGHHFRLAMARDPIPATVSHLYGFYYLLPLGRGQEAISELERALREDPLNTMCRTQLAVLHWDAGKYEEASAQFRQVLEFDENFWLALLLQALCQAERGNIDEATVSAERAYALAPENPDSIGALAALLSRGGESQRGAQLLAELDDFTAYGVPVALSIYHVIRMEYDKAAEWVVKGIEENHPHILPASCGPNRKHFVACGEWPRLARMLRLSGLDSGPSA